MAHATDDLLVEDIEAYLDAHERKSLLRFITCGSVDDGKSSLIGRLLYECQLIVRQHVGVIQQPAKQAALAVVHAAAGDETQQALCGQHGTLFSRRTHQK